MVRASHTPQQPLHYHPSRAPWGWVMLWSAEEMLDGQHPRVAIPAHARTAHKGLLQKKDWKRISAESSFMSFRQPNCSRDWTELNWTEKDKKQTQKGGWGGMGEGFHLRVSHELKGSIPANWDVVLDDSTLQVHAVLPLVPLTFPSLWIIANTYGQARILAAFHVAKTLKVCRAFIFILLFSYRLWCKIPLSSSSLPSPPPPSTPISNSGDKPEQKRKMLRRYSIQNLCPLHSIVQYSLPTDHMSYHDMLLLLFSLEGGS